MIYYQMTKNSAVSRNLTHVIIIDIVPLHVYELDKITYQNQFSCMINELFQYDLR